MDLEVFAIKGLLVLVLLAGSWPALAEFASAGSEDHPARDVPMPGSNPYATRTDQELTALAASWDGLDLHQRRALLTEMRQRMARRGSQQAGVLHIRSERRYGRIIQQADGRVIRIETQVVQVRPVTEQSLMSGGFGVGFERRTGGREDHPASAGHPDGAHGGQEPPSEIREIPVITVRAADGRLERIGDPAVQSLP